MSKVEVIRVLVNQRLSAVAEEIVELFEKTIAEYQDSMARLSEETERQRQLLGTACAGGTAGTAGGPSHEAEFQQVSAIKDVPPKEQKLGLSLNGVFVGAHHIKEEQEEIWSSQEGEQFQEVEKFTFSSVPSKIESQEGQENVPYILKVLHGDFQQTQGYNQEVPSEEHEWTPAPKQEDPEQSSDMEQEKLRSSQQREKLMELEENSVTEFSFIPAPVKSEVDEEEPQSAQLHKRQTENSIKVEPSDSSSTQQMEPESDGEDCGQAESLTSLASEKTSNSSDSETEDSDDDWKRTTTKQPRFKVVMDKKVVKSKPVQQLDPAPVSEDKTSDSSDAETEDSDNDLGKSKESQSSLNSMKLKEIPASSHSKQHLKKHTKTQTAQMAFHGVHKKNLDKRHVTTDSTKRHLSSSWSKKHKGSASRKPQNSQDKIYICSGCGKRFQKKAHLVLHMKMHNGKSNLSGTDDR